MGFEHRVTDRRTTRRSRAGSSVREAKSAVVSVRPLRQGIRWGEDACVSRHAPFPGASEGLITELGIVCHLRGQSSVRNGLAGRPLSVCKLR